MDDRLAQQLRGLFITELEEHVADVNRDLLALERAGEGERGELLRALLRTIHTVKGAARAASVPVIERASHQLEEVLTGLRDGKLTHSGDLYALLFATTDALADISERLAGSRSLDDTPLHGLIPRLTAMCESAAPARETDETAPEVATPTVPALRIAADKVDELLARSGELLVAIRSLDSLAEELAASGTSVKQFPGDRRAIVGAAHALDEVIRRLRMVPFAESTARLDRAVRDVAAATGKDVEFVVLGGDLEIDRAVLDALRDPLLHLVRNAVDHGIEAPSARIAAGRSARGRVTVEATIRGAEVRVTVSDDGPGIDTEAIRAQLRRRGLPEPIDPRDLLRTVFSPGFSTAKMITDLSGRGVGLDVVKRTVEALRGTIDVSAGAGAVFTMSVPVTLSALRGLEVSVSGRNFVIPVPSVKLLLRVGTDDVHRVSGMDTISFEGRPIPLVPLTAVLGLASTPRLDAGKLPVVVLSDGSEVALVVDALVDERDVVVKSLGPRLRGTKVVSGATLLPSGRVALILHVPEVVARARRGSTSIGVMVAGNEAAPKRRVILVDDSITTRSLEKSILEGHGYVVFVGVDGEDGWRLLQETPDIDAVVSDVEMPRLDGFGLCAKIRASPRFQHVPVILVTGLAKPEDRARGLAAGANAYLVKSAFDQQQLLDILHQVT